MAYKTLACAGLDRFMEHLPGDVGYASSRVRSTATSLSSAAVPFGMAQDRIDMFDGF